MLQSVSVLQSLMKKMGDVDVPQGTVALSNPQ